MLLYMGKVYLKKEMQNKSENINVRVTPASKHQPGCFGGFQ
jgi:hypothetical protein